MKKVILLGIVTVIIITQSVFAHNQLRVGDPRRSWSTYQGTIEEAIVSIRPKGIYMEVGLYLTFSARGTNYGVYDSLEVAFHFDLPQEAIVHDSWLWVGEDIVRAKIMDKWTAASIYENIVKRRRDPSILYKRSATQYELRIFPMPAKETRKVKITYLVPTQWSTTSVMAVLPTNLLRTSRYPLSTFYALVWAQNEWLNPKIVEFPDIEFKNHSDKIFGNYKRADLPTAAVQSYLNISFDSPLKKGVYLSQFESQGEGLYQLAFMPSKAFNFSVANKVAILFDYDISKSNLKSKELLSDVKSMLHSTFNQNDYFNLFFSNLNINRVSENWLPADSLLIEQTFSDLTTNPISNYSNLTSLLANAIDFINNQGFDGNILLITNSDQVGDYQIANQLIQDLLKLMDPILPIHVVDFQDRNYSTHAIGGRSYWGNEYFYTNISRLTSGDYFNTRANNSFIEALSSGFNSINGFISSFDLQTSLTNGFCFGRFTSGTDGQSVYLNRPILQVGKFHGNFPFKIDVSGIYNSQVFSQTLEIPTEQVFAGDSLMEEMWVGKTIDVLETKAQTNNVVAEIIDYSIFERVLSRYSAFICLEPSDLTQVCYDCLDESELISGIEDIEQEIPEDSLLQAYPNPFNNETTISINLSGLKNKENISFNIYNVMGQLVRTFQIEDAAMRKETQFIWDGRDQNGVMVSSGTYFFILNTPVKRHSLKLLLVK